LHAVSHIELSSSSLPYLKEQAWSNAGNSLWDTYRDFLASSQPITDFTCW